MLLQGNCLTLLPTVPTGSVDMVLADPPYGTTRNTWDSVIPLLPLWKELDRVCRDNAAVVLFCQQPFTSELVLTNRKNFKYLWYWDKHLKTGFLNAKKQPLRQVEEIAVFYRRQCHFAPPERRGRRHQRCKPENIPSKNYGSQPNRSGICTISDSYCASTLLTDYPKQIFKSGHPTQKPVPLLEYLIRTYTEPGETVLDFCMGSGSTGVAAANLGREFIGMEMDEGYYRIACDRIEEARRVAEESAEQTNIPSTSIEYAGIPKR